ncbi:MAG: type III secretion system chaperone [Pseudomonadota bacterium]
MRLEEVATALAELGPRLDPVLITEFEERVAVLTFDEDTEMLLEYDKTRELLVFVGSVGASPPRAESTMLLVFMKMNNLRETLGGLHFAIEEEGGEFMLIWDLPYHNLTTEGLYGAIVSFRGRIEFWRQIVSDGRLDRDAIMEDGINFETMIRV